MIEPLPIDAVLPQVVSLLGQAQALVLEAPAGAGKTTRVPPALLRAGLGGDREIVVLEPRRLAVRMAARRVAQEMGEPLGRTVGYQVRFEEVAGADTRIRFVTEGILTRRLLSDPTLANVGAIVFDEFHERHLDGDLGLALARRLSRTSRPDLKIVVMSATLDAAPIARLLDSPSLRSEGRLHPVAIEYLSATDARPLEVQVAAAVRRLAREEPDGDLLVFLPGAAEIRRAAEALGDFARSAGMDLLPLHGDLSAEEQDRAVQRGARRKVILSTNVAETSVTIEGVVAVVDSGLAHIASYSPWSGLPLLKVAKISRASAAQRAFRAGRTRPGRCVRLYTRHDHDTRPEHERPEIQRADLAQLVLSLASFDLAASALEWLDPPPAASLEAATALLARLGALDATARITARGRAMVQLPVHPRLARLLLEAEARGLFDEGCVLAALLGERDIRDRTASRGPTASSSDLLDRLESFAQAERVRFAPDRLSALGLSVGPTLAVDRVRRQLGRPRSRSPARRSPHTQAVTEEHLLCATLAAFPDRVGRRRELHSDQVVLVGGGGARLAKDSAVRDAALLVAVDVEERAGEPGLPHVPRGTVTVRVASAVTAEMLLDVFPNALRYEDVTVWNAEAERAETVSRVLYDDLLIEESPAGRLDAARAAALLYEAASRKGVRSFAPEGTIDRLVRRIELARRFAPEAGFEPPAEADLSAALASLCATRRSLAELRDASLLDMLFDRLGAKRRALLDRIAPERVMLGGARSVEVNYPSGEQPPFIESRLQDFFGMTAGPAIAGGRVPLTLHLLAPNRRAVQVTSDLQGFWARHYPALRKELGRRYPRHAWPDDPARSPPPAARRRT